jgi:hypothetical protein
MNDSPTVRTALRIAALLLCASLAHAQSDRYAEIERLVKRNRHVGPHLTLVVDARTIKAVRGRITGEDIPVLVRMLGDADYGVASAAAGLLATLGKPAEPALREAARGHSPAAVHAQDSLRLLADCSDPALRQTMNPDVCPAGR